MFVGSERMQLQLQIREGAPDSIFAFRRFSDVASEKYRISIEAQE